MSIISTSSTLTRVLAVVAALLALGATGHAQQKPTAAAIEAAREIIIAKGAMTMFNPLIPGVIEQGKDALLQQNPMLGKDLNEAAAKLRTEMAPRLAQLTDEIARIYATHFTEKELKEILAFYKSPLGKKIIVDEPKALDQTLNFAQDWALKLSDEVATKIRAEMKKKGHDL